MLQDLLRAPSAQSVAARRERVAVVASATRLEDHDQPWLARRLVMSLVAFIRWQLRYYRLMAGDPRTPCAPKLLLWSAVIYAVSPIGIVPDMIPILGYLDDVIIVPALIMIAVRRVPPEVVIDCRLQMGIKRRSRRNRVPSALPHR